mmetsp:Transcript_42060/g.75278  ORF Transcript_42060/g.75278 Transcript_42060/m.75278 type:complete len:315 (-) Transcript_42060:921-1865(-)
MPADLRRRSGFAKPVGLLLDRVDGLGRFPRLGLPLLALPERQVPAEVAHERPELAAQGHQEADGNKDLDGQDRRGDDAGQPGTAFDGRDGEKQRQVEADSEGQPGLTLQEIGLLVLPWLDVCVQAQERRGGPHCEVRSEAASIVHKCDDADEDQLADHVHGLPVAGLRPEPAHKEDEGLLLHPPPVEAVQVLAQQEEGKGYAQPVEEDEELGRQRRVLVPLVVAVDGIVGGKESPGACAASHVDRVALIEVGDLLNEGGVDEVQDHSQANEVDLQRALAPREAPQSPLALLIDVHGRPLGGGHAPHGLGVFHQH